MVEHGGFYRTSDQTWVKLERIQFVGACNPPTDPGRKPLTHRYQYQDVSITVQLHSSRAWKKLFFYRFSKKRWKFRFTITLDGQFYWVMGTSSWLVSPLMSTPPSPPGSCATSPWCTWTTQAPPPSPRSTAPSTGPCCASSRPYAPSPSRWPPPWWSSTPCPRYDRLAFNSLKHSGGGLWLQIFDLKNLYLNILCIF